MFSKGVTWRMLGACGRVSLNLARKEEKRVSWWKEGKERKGKYLVFIILRKAPMEFNRVTMCSRPVHASVTMMTGQENARNSSKDWKWCPHDCSYLPFPCKHVEK